MFDLLKLRIQHGYQAIPDLRAARPVPTHRGFPMLDETICTTGCAACSDVCPTHAIALQPLSLDLGKCTFCDECERACPAGSIRFTNEHRLGSTERRHLVVASGKTFESYHHTAVQSRKEIRNIFGRSLKLREVSAAGCNGCEMELGACSNVNFDMGRFGIDFVASPRHADGIVITGPISKNMAPALRDTYAAIPDSKIVIAVGACAISGGIFADSDQLNRDFFDQVHVDLFIPGCPPHPLVFIDAVLGFIGR